MSILARPYFLLEDVQRMCSYTPKCRFLLNAVCVKKYLLIGPLPAG